MTHAYTHWFGFLGATSQSSRALFDRTTWVNRCALGFFRYCAEITLGTSGATIVPTSLLAGSGSPSWLWHKGKGVPHILIDFDAIHEKVPNTERKTVTRILIHEVGHLVLHYPDIASFARGRVSSCTALQEQEAWVFAGIVVGLALGQTAPDLRPQVVDNAWKLSV